MSHASCSGDGVDTQSKVPDEQQLKTFSQDKDDADEETDVNDDSEETESNNDGDDLTHSNLSTYKADNEEEEEEKVDDEEENKETKKTNEMLCPRFTKVIIDYFMSRDQSISRRNKMFWHTSQDDTMFTTMRCISRHEKTQKTLKPKYVQKKDDLDTSPKKKPDQATKEYKLKKILIDKMEKDKSINRLDIQKNLYNALVELYHSEKDIITSYGDVVTLERGRDDQDKDEDPSAGSNQGSKRRRLIL
nr:hypothetical protein [Tanacetum cinerariifolium]